MRSPFAATFLSIALASSPVFAAAPEAKIFSALAPAQTSAQTPAQTRAGLEIDTAALGDSADPVESQIRAKGDQLRLEAELLPSRSPADPTVHVIVTPFTGEDMGYDIELVIHQDGAALSDTTITDRCELCTEGELVDKVGGHLRTQLGTAKGLAPATPEKDPANGTSTPDPQPDPDPDPVKTKVPLGTPGKAGIALAVTGVAAAGLGIGLIIKKDAPRDNGVKLQTTRPPGYGVVAVGGVLLITGVALIVVDRMKAKKSTAAVLLPYATPRSAGMTFTTRF